MGDTLYNQYLEAVGGGEAEEATHRAAVAAEAQELEDALWEQKVLEEGRNPRVGSLDAWLREYGEPRMKRPFRRPDGLFRGNISTDAISGGI
eukprot:SAG31_NODE_3507_length_4183_cov_2.185113_4_plen_92_part_00